MKNAQPETPTTSTVPVTRICRKCLQSLPLEQFRRRRRNSELRQSDCGDCHASSERLRRQKTADDRRVARTVQRARQLVQARRDRQFVSLAVSIVRTIGPNQFAADFRNALDKAREHGRYRDAKQLLLCVTRLAEKASELLVFPGKDARTWKRVDMPDQPEEFDLSELSDSELDSRFRQLKKESPDQTIEQRP